MFRLYLGNLPWELTDDQLESLVTRFGSVVRMHRVLDTETFRFRGFAFITFASEEDGRHALRNLNGFQYQGRFLKAAPAHIRELENPFSAAQARLEAYRERQRQMQPLKRRRTRTRYSDRCY